MDLYIKQLIEAFDFNSVKKLNKNVNAIDVLIKDIVYRIIDTGRLDTKDMHFILSLPAASYKANDNEIHLLVTNCVTIFGDDCNLNWIDVSNVTNMSKLFEDSTFNGDISKWDVSNVTDMGSMFRSSKFTGDISNWNVSNVIYMDWMFYRTLFNSDISKWDVSNVNDMHRMFEQSGFNDDISDWNVSNVIDMHGMFLEAKFNRDISNWNIENGANVKNMFDFCPIKDEYKPKFNVSEAFNFDSCNKLKRYINAIDVMKSKLPEIIDIINNGEYLTQEQYDILCYFPGVYKVKYKLSLKFIILYFTELFGNECDLNCIDVSELKNLDNVFKNSKFNGDISKWDVSNIVSMRGVFMGSSFLGDISSWDVSNVKDMYQMFYGSKFNSDISKWNINNVKDMAEMFYGSLFNSDISKWNINSDCYITNMLDGCPIKDEYKPKFNVSESFDFEVINKRKKPINLYNTQIAKILKAIENREELSDEDYEILTQYTGIYKQTDKDELHSLIDYFTDLFGFVCDLNWIDVSELTDMNSLFHQSEFNGDISRWDVSNVEDMGALFSLSMFNGDISNWNVSKVQNMRSLFMHTNFTGDLSKWDVHNVKQMMELFYGAEFNGDISKWDVSNVEDMNWMFCTSKFTGDISSWDVSNVRIMEGMFYKSTFNGDISKWDVSNVENMKLMFANNDVFNNDISGWDVSNVKTMESMFAFSKINIDISKWLLNPKCNISDMFELCTIRNEYKPKKYYNKKRNIKESFEFDGLAKGKKQINACDILLLHIFNLLDDLQMITEEEYNILKQYTGIYKVKDRHDLKTLIIYFTQSIGAGCDLNWMDISNITDMSDIFWSSEFNGDISKWDVSKVTIMTSMFDSSDFNGDISGWNISNVTDMRWMFYASKFNRDLSKWIIKDCNTEEMFKDCPIKDEYYPQFK